MIYLMFISAKKCEKYGSQRAIIFCFTGWRICVRVGKAGAKTMDVADTEGFQRG
jgi:hypothetical protein